MMLTSDGTEHPRTALTTGGDPANGHSLNGDAIDRGLVVGGNDGGAMGALVRAHDWSATPLGPMAGWPPSLRIAAGICLSSRFPMFLWWGPQLVNLYNDAYVPILGRRHPDALGRPAADLWREVWPVIGPQVGAVMARGEASWQHRVPLTLERNGYPEEAFFSWSHSPVADEAGRVGGVLCVVTEETTSVQAEREQDRAAAQRDRSAAQRQLALDAARMGWWHFDPAAAFATYDRRAHEIFGVAGHERPDEEVPRRIHPDDLAIVNAKVAAALDPADPQPYSAELRVRLADGSVRWVEAHGKATFDGDGAGRRPVSFAGTVADVTDRRAADAAVREAEQRYRAVFEAARDAKVIYTPDGVVVEVNPAACRMYGYAPDEVVGTPATDRLHPGAGAMFDAFLRVAAAGGDYRCETTDRRKDGTAFPIEVVGTSFSYGGRTRLMSVIRDLSEPRRAAAALRAEEERYRALFERAAVGMAEVTLDGRFARVNAEYGRITGYAPEELAGRHTSDITHPDDVAADHALRAAVVGAGDDTGRRLKRYLRKDGAIVWAELATTVIRDPAGTPTHLIASIADVTARRAAEAARAAVEARLRLMSDALPVLVSYVDADHRYRFNNAAYEAWVGVRPADLAGRHVREVLGEDVYRRRLPQIERALAGEPVRFDGAVPHVDKGWRDAETSYVPDVADDGRTVRGFVALVYDITDRRQAERERERLLAAERAARAQAEASRAQAEASRAEAEHQGRLKDEFLATLSHELRTPLNAIMGWAQILGVSRTPEDVAQAVEVITRNAKVQTALIEELLDVSRIIGGKVRLDVRPVPLPDVVAAAVAAVRPAADAKGVRLTAALDPAAGPVAGDANRLTQIVFNLASNAIKYTPAGGRVHVSLARTATGPAGPHGRAGGPHVEVAVVDTGEGIDPGFLPFVWDRFRQADGSTTRRHGGLGLGLSIVKQLAELHGGTVRAASDGPGRGATFVVALPLMPAADVGPTTAGGPGITAGSAAAERTAGVEPPVATGAPAGPAHGSVVGAAAGVRPAAAAATPAADVAALRGLRVLVVDDEPDARALVRRLLEDRAAVVTTAGSAADALAAVRRDRPDVLLSDIGMPDEDGYALLRQVRGLSAADGGGVPAVALTAYARPDDRALAVAAGFQAHVPKPVDAAELVAAVTALAGRGAGGGRP